MEGLGRRRRNLAGLGLGMPPTHYGRVEPLLQHLACAGFDHGFAPQEGRAMHLLVQIGFDPIGFFLREQTRI